jgi:hypothetical protein
MKRTPRAYPSLEIPLDIVNHIAKSGGTFLTTMLDKDGIFDPNDLDCLAHHDNQWYEALMKINSFKSALLNASPHQYSTPSKETYQALSEVTSVCNVMIVQSVYTSIEDPQHAVYLRIAAVVHGLFCSTSSSPGLRKMLLSLLGVCARGMGEDPSLSNCIENLNDVRQGSSLHLNEIILAHGSDRFLLLSSPYDDDDDTVPWGWFS